MGKVRYCVPLRLTIYEHAVIEGIQSRFFFRFIKIEQGVVRLIHRFASSCYCVRSNTAPAFAGWPCALLKPAWRSTSACLFYTLCSPGGVVSAACTALIN